MLNEYLQIVDSPHAKSWQKEGWAESVLEWLSTVLIHDEIQLEAINTHDLACVIRFRVGTKNVYFKTSYNSREAIVTAQLGNTVPNLVPKVIAYNAERNWLLTEDAGQWLSFSDDLRLWKESVSNLAAFHQIKPGVFEGLKLPFHPFADLASRGEAFLRNTPVLQTWGLTQVQLEGLDRLIPSLRAVLERIQALDLPECFTHGDAHPNNVLVKERASVWFDWSEAGFTHPFLDVGWFLAWTFLPQRELSFTTTPELAWQFWRDYWQAQELADANITPLEVMRLALLHRTLTYHEKFYAWHGAMLPTRPQYVPYFLRLLLKTANFET
jgi:aminoglycoside phosphotransferase (APT) family kinase protein